MQYVHVKNNKVATYIKQIDNTVYFMIDGLEANLDVSKFNELYRVKNPSN